MVGVIYLFVSCCFVTNLQIWDTYWESTCIMSKRFIIIINIIMNIIRYHVLKTVKPSLVTSMTIFKLLQQHILIRMSQYLLVNVDNGFWHTITVARMFVIVATVPFRINDLCVCMSSLWIERAYRMYLFYTWKLLFQQYRSCNSIRATSKPKRNACDSRILTY